MPTQQNFSMPGPQFGNNENGSGWFSRHYRKIVFALILALLATGAGWFYQNYQARTALLKPALNEITALPSPFANVKTQQPVVNDKIRSAVSSAPLTERNNGKTIVTAAKGNGATHLARQALKEYLKDKPELAQKLGPEQRIFIEDYLRKNLEQPVKNLEIGDQITFSDNNIQAAIDKALALNDSQIKNLGQYVLLVPSLMII